jgi:hypothetical protein
LNNEWEVRSKNKDHNKESGSKGIGKKLAVGRLERGQKNGLI